MRDLRVKSQVEPKDDKKMMKSEVQVKEKHIQNIMGDMLIGWWQNKKLGRKLKKE